MVGHPRPAGRRVFPAYGFRRGDARYAARLPLYDNVLRGVAAIKLTGKPAIVRIPVGRFDMASRALDFGVARGDRADGEFARRRPRLRGAHQISAARGAVLGADPRARAPRRFRYPDLSPSANRETLAIPMIETHAARRRHRRDPLMWTASTASLLARRISHCAVGWRARGATNAAMLQPAGNCRQDLPRRQNPVHAGDHPGTPPGISGYRISA